MAISYVVKYWRGKILANLVSGAKILSNQILPLKYLECRGDLPIYYHQKSGKHILPIFYPPIFCHVHVFSVG